MSPEQPRANPRHILAFASALEGQESLRAALESRGELRTVEHSAEALAALRTGIYDLLIGTPTDLFPLARAEARQRAERILEQLGQAVCIVDRTGSLVWGNARYHSFPDPVAEIIRRECRSAFEQLRISSTDHRPPASVRRTLPVEHEHVFDLTVAPLLDVNHEVEEVVALILDVTETYRLQEKINAIDAAGRELVRLDRELLTEMDFGERMQLIEEKSVRLARELMHFDHFIVRVLDRRTNELETVIASGVPEEAANLHLKALPEGNGISGYVAATGRPYICRDVSEDPQYLPGLECAGSTMTVPLHLHDEVVGVLDVESHQKDAFSEADLQFAQIFARYLALVLHMLELLVVERSATTDQLAEDVAAELADPLNAILSEATHTVEAHGENGEVRAHLEQIIANVDRVKQRLQRLTEMPAVRGLVPDVSTRDPLLDGKRILIADDEDIIRETIADVLAKRGALPVVARDGQEAVAMIRTQHFDLVLTDIKMPYRNGYEVFAAAKQADRHCPVILVTGFGYDPEHSIVRASKEGLAGVLFKPFKVEQLVEIVDKALEARHTESAS